MRLRGKKLGLIGALGLIIGCGPIANSTTNVLPTPLRTIPQIAVTYEEAIRNLKEGNEKRLTGYEIELTRKINEYNEGLVKKSEGLIQRDKERIKHLEQYTKDFKKLIEEIKESQRRF